MSRSLVSHAPTSFSAQTPQVLSSVTLNSQSLFLNHPEPLETPYTLNPKPYRIPVFSTPQPQILNLQVEISKAPALEFRGSTPDLKL